MPARPLVAALDFSPGSRAALVRAADLARRTAAPLHVVHADVLYRAAGDDVPPDAAPSSTLRLQVERAARDVLGLDPLGPAGGDGAAAGDVTVAVVRDETVLAGLVRYLADVGAGLLVMGTHGRSGVGRLLAGSVAEACVAAAPCPVVTVPARAAEVVPGPDAPVLVGADLSGRTPAALRAAAALARWYGAPVEVLHVVRAAGPYPALAPGVFSVSDADPRAADEVRAAVERAAAEAGCPPPRAVHVVPGAPARVVAAVAEQARAGAVVLATHGRTGLAGALVGSVAEATVRRAPCPVLTLRAADVLPPWPGAPRAARAGGPWPGTPRAVPTLAPGR